MYGFHLISTNVLVAIIVPLICNVFSNFMIFTDAAENICRKEGFVRDPDNCGKFYRCVDSWGTGHSFAIYEFFCPPGTIFDEYYSVCTYGSAAFPECNTLPQQQGSTAEASVDLTPPTIVETSTTIASLPSVDGVSSAAEPITSTATEATTPSSPSSVTTGTWSISSSPLNETETTTVPPNISTEIDSTTLDSSTTINQSTIIQTTPLIGVEIESTSLPAVESTTLSSAVTAATISLGNVFVMVMVQQNNRSTTTRTPLTENSVQQTSATSTEVVPVNPSELSKPDPEQLPSSYPITPMATKTQTTMLTESVESAESVESDESESTGDASPGATTSVSSQPIRISPAQQETIRHHSKPGNDSKIIRLQIFS